MLTNREIATLVWLFVFAILAISNMKIRESFVSLIQILSNRKILSAFAAMSLYTAGMVGILYRLGMWERSLTKDTILWFFFVGTVMISHFMTNKSDEAIFRKILIDNLKIMIIFEFVMNVYNFSLVGELIFVPLITLATCMKVVAETRREHASVAKFLDFCLAFVGFLLLWLSVDSLWKNYSEYITFETLRSILLPPLLSIMLSPFVYGLVLISVYEQIFLRIDLHGKIDRDTTKAIRVMTFKKFGLNHRRLQHFLKSNAAKLLSVESKADMERLVC